MKGASTVIRNLLGALCCAIGLHDFIWLPSGAFWLCARCGKWPQSK